MSTQALVIHERLGVWARQLRPRLADRPVRLVETRSASDLTTVLATGGHGPCPVVLIDLSRRVPDGLDELGLVTGLAPNALTLVLDPDEVEGVPLLARELGATHVITGPTTPPAVLGLLSRWFPLARERAEASGWSGPGPETSEGEPWDWLAPYLTTEPSRTR